MANVYVCSKCGGIEIKAETDDELVQSVQGHMKDTHDFEITGPEVLAMAQENKPWWKIW